LQQSQFNGFVPPIDVAPAFFIIGALILALVLFFVASRFMRPATPGASPGQRRALRLLQVCRAVGLIGVVCAIVYVAIQVPTSFVAAGRRIVPSTAPWRDQPAPAPPSAGADSVSMPGEELRCINDEALREAASQAFEILKRTCGANTTSEAMAHAKRFFERMPSMIEQRIYFDPERWIGERQHAEIGVLAETYGRASKPFCLYVGALRDWFGTVGIHTNEERVAGLAWILFHEAFHLPSVYSGFLPFPVEGDEAVRRVIQPRPSHIGLHLWSARLASRAMRDTQSPASMLTLAQQKACCAELHRVHGLVDSPTAYSARLRQVISSAAPHLPAERVGPPDWPVHPPHQLPDECTD